VINPSQRPLSTQDNTTYKQKDKLALMMEAARTSETSVDNYFTRQYIPEDKSELHTRRREKLKSHKKDKHPCPERYSNQRSQHPKPKPIPYTTRPPVPAFFIHTLANSNI
jgi:hypothetical protein